MITPPCDTKLDWPVVAMMEGWEAYLEASFVAMVLVSMLILLFLGWKSPEVVVSDIGVGGIF